jgi:hypothetical protein
MEKQYYVVLSLSTLAKSPREALEIALEMVKDEAGYVEIFTLNGRRHPNTDIDTPVREGAIDELLSGGGVQ